MCKGTFFASKSISYNMYGKCGRCRLKDYLKKRGVNGPAGYKCQLDYVCVCGLFLAFIFHSEITEKKELQIFTQIQFKNTYLIFVW